MTVFYDEHNNFTPPRDLDETQEGRKIISDMNHLRLVVAAEFMRCKIYGLGGIDSALDDADTALGLLNRLGKIS